MACHYPCGLNGAVGAMASAPWPRVTMILNRVGMKLSQSVSISAFNRSSGGAAIRW
jgi:hypothetical protein